MDKTQSRVIPVCPRMMADLVIGHLQRFTARLRGDTKARSSNLTEALMDKQPFLLEKNWGHTFTSCILEDEFPQLVQRNKVHFPLPSLQDCP